MEKLIQNETCFSYIALVGLEGPMAHNIAPVAPNRAPVAHSITPVAHNISPVAHNISPVAHNITPAVSFSATFIYYLQYC